jgi:anti-sigma B factor antagonist
MEIKEQRSGNILILSIAGRLDTTTYRILENRLLEVIGNGQIRIIMECSELDYISSSGLRVFLLGLKKITAEKGRFILSNLQDAIREIMEIAGFTTIFEIRPTLGDALRSANTEGF